MAKFERPTDTYTPTQGTLNLNKYNDDSTAIPPVPISSTKVDADINRLIDAVNDIDQITGGTGEADLEGAVTNLNTRVTTNEADIANLTAGTVPDADYGDITVSSNATQWTIDDGAVTLAKLSTEVQEVVASPNIKVPLSADENLTTGQFVVPTATGAEGVGEKLMEFLTEEKTTLAVDATNVNTLPAKDNYFWVLVDGMWLNQLTTQHALRIFLCKKQADGAVLIVDSFLIANSSSTNYFFATAATDEYGNLFFVYSQGTTIFITGGLNFADGRAVTAPVSGNINVDTNATDWRTHWDSATGKIVVIHAESSNQLITNHVYNVTYDVDNRPSNISFSRENSSIVSSTGISIYDIKYYAAEDRWAVPYKTSSNTVVRLLTFSLDGSNITQNVLTTTLSSTDASGIVTGGMLVEDGATTKVLSSQKYGNNYVNFFTIDRTTWLDTSVTSVIPDWVLSSGVYAGWGSTFDPDNKVVVSVAGIDTSNTPVYVYRTVKLDIVNETVTTIASTTDEHSHVKNNSLCYVDGGYIDVSTDATARLCTLRTWDYGTTADTFFGAVEVGVNATETANVVTFGEAPATGLTAGVFYYLDELGALTPSNTGRRVGYALEPTKIFITR